MLTIRGRVDLVAGASARKQLVARLANTREALPSNANGRSSANGSADLAESAAVEQIARRGTLAVANGESLAAGYAAADAGTHAEECLRVPGEADVAICLARALDAAAKTAVHVDILALVANDTAILQL